MHALAALATLAVLLAPPATPATSPSTATTPPTPVVADAPVPSHEVVPVFARLDLGVAAPGEPAAGTIWLANLGDRAARIAELKGSCGCIAFGADAARDIGARHVASIPVTMLAPVEPGAVKEKTVTVRLADGTIAQIVLVAHSDDAD